MTSEEDDDYQFEQLSTLEHLLSDDERAAIVAKEQQWKLRRLQQEVVDAYIRLQQAWAAAVADATAFFDDEE